MAIKMTKDQVVGILNENKTNKDLTKGLRDRVAYTLKNLAKAPVSELRTLAVEVTDELRALAAATANIPTPKPVEALVKSAKAPGGKRRPGAKPEKEATPVVEAEKAPTDENQEASDMKVKNPAPRASRTATKATTPKLQTKKPLNKAAKPMLTVEDLFPRTYNHKDLGELVALDAADFNAFKKAVEDGRDLYILTYWPKDLLKKHEYAEMQGLPAPVKSLPDNFDVLTVVMACDTMQRVYAASLYTEGMFNFDGDDFRYVERLNPKNGTLHNIRCSNGLEFQLYELVA